MLDAEKIHLMTRLARYENGQGKEDLKISRYYRSDYIGIGLFKNLLVVTLGYILLWSLIVVYNLDFLLDNLHKLNFSFIALEVVIGYVIVILIYSIITYVMRFSRYLKAKKSVQEYYMGLSELLNLYGEPEQDSELPKMLRGQNE